MQYLVSLGADIQAQGDYCINAATTFGHGDIVRYLVSIGGAIREIDYGIVRISFAWGYVAIVRYIVALGMKFTDYDDLESPDSRHQKRFARYLASIGVAPRRHHARVAFAQIRAASEKAARRLYSAAFAAWVPRCYDRRRRAGRRMGRRNLAAFRRLCAIYFF